MKQHYKNNKKRVNERTLDYYYNNRNHVITKQVRYVRNRRKNDKDFVERTCFRSLIKRFRTVGASSEDIEVIDW